MSSFAKHTRFSVLILIILEYYIRVKDRYPEWKVGIEGLNPYYTGILYTRQLLQFVKMKHLMVLILIILEYYIRAPNDELIVQQAIVLILIILEYYIREQNYQRTIIHSLLTLKPKIFYIFTKNSSKF